MVECEDSSTKIEANEQAEFNTSKLRKTLTNTEILAQAIVFLLAGSETTSTTICWIAHNLAMSPECQDKLIEEVDTVLEQHVI